MSYPVSPVCSLLGDSPGRAGFGHGSGERNTLRTIEYIAVVAPIPSANVSTAAAVNPGDLPQLTERYPEVRKDTLDHFKLER
jgi:hypothetical protein